MPSNLLESGLSVASVNSKGHDAACHWKCMGAAFHDLLMMVKRTSADGKLLFKMTSCSHFPGIVGVSRNDREISSLPTVMTQ